MAKHIIICADGTGNTTIKGRGTNVFKLYEAVDENGHRFNRSLIEQVAIYHDGVGTESLKWVRIFAGATGWGLSRNVKQLYGELARVYDPGDHIFLFGFSRGAFTVRALAGLITACGILDLSRYPTNGSFNRAAHDAYREYRRKYQTVVSRLVRGRVTLDKAALRRRFSVDIPAFTDPTIPVIDFIGVWDTVDAVGLPLRIADLINRVFYAFKFPDTTLSDEVGHACHALALDEERQSFAPVMWRESRPIDAGRIEQVWFAGAHSNVGGGYPQQGMSLVALDWMMTRAEAHGLRLLAAERQLYRDAADVNDKLYDPRAGLGVFYRWQPRDADALSRTHVVRPKVHRTVFDRIARNTDGYAPGSVPPNPHVITTSAPPPVAEALRQLVTVHHGNGGPLIRRQRAWLRVGHWSYAALMVSTIVFAAFMFQTYWADAHLQGDWKTIVIVLATTLVSSNWLGIAARTAWHVPWVVSVAALSLAIGLAVDHHLDAAYSQFWHALRVRLREVLQGTSLAKTSDEPMRTSDDHRSAPSSPEQPGR